MTENKRLKLNDKANLAVIRQGFAFCSCEEVCFIVEVL
jgi:hypothetical protein